jgi:hypothetical protein
MRFISPELSAKRAAAGRAGGYATFFKHGREQMILWAKKGGRPRLPKLAELESQFSASSIIHINGRRNRLPGGCSIRNIEGALNLKIKEGELAVNAPSGSPEGV